MKKVFETIKANPLFKEIGISDFEAMLQYIEGRAGI